MTIVKPTHLIILVLCFWASFIAAPAYAADPYTVANVHVDAVGADAIDAQTKANQQGQYEAAQILFRRLTLPAERAGKNLGSVSQETVSRMIRGLTVANEKRSNKRYLGDVTVAFNPAQVQNFLKSQNLNIISSQAQTRLILPTEDGQSLWGDSVWQSIWRNGAYENSLTPLRGVAEGQGSDAIISASQAQRGDMDALKLAGAQFGVRQILVANLSGSEGNYRVSLKDYSLDEGEARTLGSVSAPTYNEAALAVLEKLENDWKDATVSLVQNAQTTQVSILYRSLGDWLDLQDAINGSAQIQDARLDALSKDGALMTLTYGGDLNRLKNELSYKGVDLRTDPQMGLVLNMRGRY